MKAKISRPVPNGPMNSLTSVVRLVDQRLLIDDLGVVGEHLGDPLLDGGDVLTLGDADVDGVVDALGAEHLGGGRRVPQGERGAAERVAVAEADRARERERVRTGRRDDVDRVADLEVVVVGRVLVDRHLVRAARRGAVTELDRAVGVGAVPRGAEHRRPAGGDRLAVGVDDLGAALQPPVARSTPGTAATVSTSSAGTGSRVPVSLLRRTPARCAPAGRCSGRRR